MMASAEAQKKMDEDQDPVTLGPGPGGDASTLNDTPPDTPADKPIDALADTTQGKANQAALRASEGGPLAEDGSKDINSSTDKELKVEGAKYVKQDSPAESDVPAMQDGAGDSATAASADNGDAKSQSRGQIHTLLERDLAHLSRSERVTLFEAGVKLTGAGEADEALACLLGAITGLSESSTFSDLPKCLHSVADIYFDKKEYEKAVYFIQAEKMYYETALIDMVNVQKQTDDDKERRQSQSDGKGEEGHINDGDQQPGEETSGDDPRKEKDDELSPDAKKGQEFENLARLCLKEGKLQLALEYCGKATKMYQAVYGEEHPVTVAALDLFTVIYADVGKKLYSDAMQKFDKEEEALAEQKSHDQTSQSPDTELRHRGTNNNKEVDGEATQQANNAHPHAGELEPVHETERDDWVMTILLMVIFFLVAVFIAVVFSSIYCYNNMKSTYCAQTRGDLNYWYMYVRHLVHDIRKSFR